MSVSSRSILEGLQIGNALGAPIARGMQQSREQQFLKQQQDQALRAKLAESGLPTDLSDLDAVQQEAANRYAQEQKMKQDYYNMLGLKAQNSQDQFDPNTGMIINKVNRTAQPISIVQPGATGGKPDLFPQLDTSGLSPAISSAAPITLGGKNAQQESMAKTKFENDLKLKQAADAMATVRDSEKQDFQSGENDKKLIGKNGLVDVKRWDSLVKETDPTQASSRTPLGVVVNSDNKVNRALEILNKPVVTKQDLGAVAADYASILQQGNPTEYGMSEQNYETLKTKAAGLVQFISGQPTDAISPAVKDQIRNNLLQFKATNAAVINQHFDNVEDTKPELIASHAAAWAKIRSRYANGLAGGPSGENNNQNAEAVKWLLANPNDPRAPAIKKKLGL